MVIFDTTLRDGEQCPGATMTFEEKLEVADLLDEMGVDIIEAGFPIASQGDFDAVSEIARRVKNAVVAGLARAISADIARAGEAVRHAKRPRIHTFVSTSPIHLAHQMRKGEDEVVEIIQATVTQARNLVDNVEWSAMDATRTLDRLSLPLRRPGDPRRRDDDQPARHGRLRHAGGIRQRCSARCASACRIPTRRSSPSIATTISASPSPTRSPACRRGARQVECTINGLGERAGNAALEEVVMALRTRGDALPYTTGIDATHADARLASRLGGDLVPGAVQQGDRRPERLCARERHPPGRHAEERPDLRDHDAGIGRRLEDLADHGQALRPRRLQVRS